MHQHFFCLFLFLSTFFGSLIVHQRVDAFPDDSLLEECSNKDMKILVLIVACDYNPSYIYAAANEPVFPELQKVWRSYMNYDPEHVEVYFMKAKSDLATDYEIEGDTIWCKGTETWIPGILNKTILSMEAMLPRLHEFDYVIRTNLSSFFIFPRLLKFLETLPKEKCYCGERFTYSHWAFAQGAGIIFSSDLVKMLVENKNQIFNSSIIDDAALGLFFHDHQVELIEPSLYRMDILTLQSWDANKDKIPPLIYHFRLKNHAGLRIPDEIFVQREMVKMFYGEVEERNWSNWTNWTNWTCWN